MNDSHNENSSLECNICGRRHRTEQCQLLSKTKKVNDSIAPSKARLSLPTNLQLVYFENGTVSVLAKVPVLTGTLFGPFVAPRTLMVEDNVRFPIKIFHRDGDGPTFYLDTTNEEECNWMCLILPASSPSEQNLICYQMKDDIYFTTIKEIPKGQELRVWYAPYYAKKMGKLAYPSTEESIQSIINDHGYSSVKRKMTKDSQNPRDAEVQKLVSKLGPAALGAVLIQGPWKCPHCSFKESEDVTRLAAHLRHHYKPKHKGLCDLRLGSPIECVICNKAFSTPFYLYRHLMKHTGEYTCLQCCKVFARKANLVSHPCLPAQESEGIGGKASFSCFYCNKKYSQEHVLKKHLSKHIHPSMCGACHKSFPSSRRLKQHRCVSAGSANVNALVSNHIHSCPDCGREFLRLSALEKHRLIHDPVALSQTLKEKEDFQQLPSSRGKKVEENAKTGEHVCEICGKTFGTAPNLKVHQLGHGEKKFSCSKCPKRFHRRDLWQLHQTVHLEAKVPCPECNKLFKTKHSMEVHLKIHKGKMEHKCGVCGKTFSQKGNLQRHVLTHAALPDKGVVCQVCSKLFLSKEYLSTHMLEHTQGKIHQCTKCPKAFVKACLLARHERLLHGQHKFTCSACGWLANNATALRKHLLKQHGEIHVESEVKNASWEVSHAGNMEFHTEGKTLSEEVDVSSLVQQVTDIENSQLTSFDAILNLPVELNVAKLRNIRVEGGLDFTIDTGHEAMLMQYEGDYLESDGINPCILSESGGENHDNDLGMTTNVLLYVLADTDAV